MFITVTYHEGRAVGLGMELDSERPYFLASRGSRNNALNSCIFDFFPFAYFMRLFH